MDAPLNPKVAKVFDTYPKEMQEKLFFLRELIFDIAMKEKDIEGIEETLKWGEPSYLTKNGSTLRIAWKKAKPNHYAIYFNCKTRLVSTFRELFSDIFTFEGNRAIIFHKNDTVPIKELQYCILLSLSYHKRKHLSMLDN